MKAMAKPKPVEIEDVAGPLGPFRQGFDTVKKASPKPMPAKKKASPSPKPRGKRGATKRA